MTVPRLASIAALADPDSLTALFGSILSLDHSPLATTGYTAARHERIAIRLEDGGARSLVLKIVRLEEDWTARRTGDTRGREAALLDEPALAAVWEHVACPYLAFAVESGAIGLLMEDLTPHLLPDVREPLREEDEDRLLGALAALHARFWESPALELPWLAGPAALAGMLDARYAADPGAIALLSPYLRENVPRGWEKALALLPARAREWMTIPAEELARAWDRLPRTLVHGDVKVANFALVPGGRVAAFDWAVVGAAPAAVDLGWYLAVNATRLARPKEQVAARYRSLLARRLAAPLGDADWRAFLEMAVLCGARMMLWSKAVRLDTGGSAAREEWRWWTERLEACGDPASRPRVA